MTLKQLPTLLICIAIPLVIGSISGFATAREVGGWFRLLQKPTFNPPSYLFAPVWTTLYALMGISLYLIWSSPKNAARSKALQIFSLQLFLNFSWSILFFSFHLLFVAVLAILKGAPILLAIMAGAAIGLMLPHMVVSMQISKRLAKFNARFPDAIELMVRGLRSGLPISETLGIVSTEIPDPVGTEFRAVGDRIKIGKTMESALEETAEKIGTPEFMFFCITLAIQRETGGNLAETLMNLAEVLRKRAQMKLKIKAMSSESKASAYIIGVLPFMVFGIIYYVNPEYMLGFFRDQRLIMAGLGGMVWMAIGAFIMSRMIAFEI